VKDVLLADPEPATRPGLVAWLVEMGFALPVAIHPSAVVAGDAVVGPGTVIGAGVVVGVGTQIGGSVFVGASATIGAACTIGDAVEIGAGAHLAARVHVGREARIGVGAVVRENSRLGIGSVTGDGALVLGDTAAYDVATGAPTTYRGMTATERRERTGNARGFLRSVTGQR
jgi:UDP-3-O-[3-hydroxymyristoyl] glucosamine N-acyltransferase